MSTEPRPNDKSRNGVLGILSANVAALVQAGALGLLSLFIYFLFQITQERIKDARETVTEFHKALSAEREHDAAQREHARRALAELQTTLSRDHKDIRDALDALRAALRKKGEEEGGAAGLALPGGTPSPPAAPPDSLGFNLATALVRPGGAAWRKAGELAGNYEAAADRLAAQATGGPGETPGVAEASKELQARNAATLGLHAAAWREWLGAWQRRMDGYNTLERGAPAHYVTAYRETAAGLRGGR